MLPYLNNSAVVIAAGNTGEYCPLCRNFQPMMSCKYREYLYCPLTRVIRENTVPKMHVFTIKFLVTVNDRISPHSRIGPHSWKRFWRISSHTRINSQGSYASFPLFLFKLIGAKTYHTVLNHINYFTFCRIICYSCNNSIKFKIWMIFFLLL